MLGLDLDVRVGVGVRLALLIFGLCCYSYKFITGHHCVITQHNIFYLNAVFSVSNYIQQLFKINNIG